MSRSLNAPKSNVLDTLADLDTKGIERTALKSPFTDRQGSQGRPSAVDESKTSLIGAIPVKYLRQERMSQRDGEGREVGYRGVRRDCA